MRTQVNAAGFLIVLVIFTVLSHMNWSAISMHNDKDLLSGQKFMAIEREYDQAFIPRSFAISFWAAVDYVLFGTGQPGIEIGRSGWFFSSEEYNNLAFDSDHIKSKLNEIERVQRRLAENGIALYVVPVPAKARVYGEYLPRPLPGAAGKRLIKFERWLTSNGIRSVSLLDRLLTSKAQAEVFLPQDTHWSPFGAQQAALKISSSLRSLEREVRWNNVEYHTQLTSKEKGFNGDLMNFLPLAPHFSFLLPDQDVLKRYETTRLTELGLFDEVVYEVALVGTSYSAKPEWNFVGFLQEALGTNVLDYSQEGVGPFQPMQEFLSGDAMVEHPIKVVIWELPERYLAVDATR